MITKSHYFMSLPGSPWPYISSVNAFSFFMSTLIFFKKGEFFPFSLSLSCLIWSSFAWWVFYSSEMNSEGNSTSKITEAIKIAMILFISSEVFFFFSFFWSYMHYFLCPSMEVGTIWPPQNIHMFDFSSVPLVNTLVLLASGATITISHHLLTLNKKSSSVIFLFMTVILGFFFSILQVMEYKTSFFSLTDSSFGTSFFMLTGFHGIHVLIGSIFLGTVMWWILMMKGKLHSFVSFELASWYWHFVDVVWLFVFFLLYYMNS